jgi:hypothetical protein
MRRRDVAEAIPPEARRALKHLGEALEVAGWKLVSPPSGGALEAARRKQRIPLEVRYAREPRRSVVRALLADAILSGRARVGPKGTFLAIVGAPAISPAMAASLDAYAAEVAPGQPFGYADERGFARVNGPGFEEAKRAATDARARGVGELRPRDLFSDMNQWMLKALLGGPLDRNIITVPRNVPGVPGELSRAAGVSMPSAWRLLASLRAAGHLDEAGRVVRVPELFAAWRAAALRPHREFGASWVLPGRSPIERLRRDLADSSTNSAPVVCLGLFAACDALGLGHVRGAPMHLYVRRADPGLLERFGLVETESGRAADVLVRVARWPESVFRASARPKGVPVTDTIQCWLDVSSHPARGAEQAAYLWKRVLGPALAGGGPQP